jgi:DNA-binding transcriptional LysR family regulator
MQFDALKVFVDVAGEHSFTKAANLNDLSQSAVSQIVSKLEKRLGVRLLIRTRQLKLTGPGQVFFDGCKQLIRQFEELEASVRETKAQPIEHVYVAAIYSVGLGDMGQYVESFRAFQPSAEIHIDYLHPDRVYERVLEGIADFGLVSFPRKARELVSLPWRDEEMVLACSPAHPLAGLESVRPEQLASAKYIGFDRELVIRKEVDRFLREQGVTVEPAMEFDNIENIKKAVDEAGGVALLPRPTLRRELQAGTLVAIPLDGCRMVRPLGIIQRRRRKPNAAAQRFLDLLRHPLDGPSATAEAKPATNGSPRRRNGAAGGVRDKVQSRN